MAREKVSETVIRRLPKYHRYLVDLEAQGEDRVSSKDLSELTGFTASQIRQDLNNFGGFGQQGYGYKVSLLKEVIEDILGIGRADKAVLVGAGRLGSVITGYPGFKNSGLEIEALFDQNESIVGSSIEGKIVHDISKLGDFLDEHPEVNIGIITIPKDGVDDIVDILVSHGIKGIWNFAPVDIRTDAQDVIIENVRLNDSFLTLSYYLSQMDAEEDGEEPVSEDESDESEE